MPSMYRVRGPASTVFALDVNIPGTRSLFSAAFLRRWVLARVRSTLRSGRDRSVMVILRLRPAP